MSLRDRLRRIEKAAQGSYITIETSDGRTLHFSERDLIEAWRSMGARVRALYCGEEIPPPHPLEAAAKDAVRREGPPVTFVDVDVQAPGYQAWKRARRLGGDVGEEPHEEP